MLWSAFRSSRELGLRESFVIASFGWIVVSAFSAVPFIIHGSIPSFTDAFFEMMSGYTTTGATILTDIESLPHGLIFWRSETHLLGGMGFLTLTVLFLPHGMGGLRLFRAESSPGQVITRERFTPRNRDAMHYLWGIYLALNLIQVLLLCAGGMSLFDSLCHAFGTVSTSGYSPYNASIGHYGSAYFEWVITVFMFLGGVTFMLFYHLPRGDWGVLRLNTELLWYVGCRSLLLRRGGARSLARGHLFPDGGAPAGDVSGHFAADHHRVYHRRLRALAPGCPNVPLRGLLCRRLCRLDHQWDQDHPLRAHLEVHGRPDQEDLLPASDHHLHSSERTRRRSSHRPISPSVTSS